DPLRAGGALATGAADPHNARIHGNGPPRASGALGVRAEVCIRCAACASVAPGLFAVDRGPARVLRAPETEAERLAARAAAVLCPTGAVRGLEERDGR